jgi:hypothetical protein
MEPTKQTSLTDQPAPAEPAAQAPKPEAATPAPAAKKQPSQLTRADQSQIVKRIRTEQTSVLNPVEYEQMKMLANDFIKSGSVPKSFENASQILMALQSGREMGMTPVESMQSLYIVNGMLNIWGKAVPRRLREHGYQLNYTEESPESCTVVVKNQDGTEMYTETLTFREAQDSGYTTDSNGRLKIGWRLGVNRKLKLRYGALSILIKTYLPEVLGSTANIVEVAQDYDPEAEQIKVDGAQARIDAAIAKRKPATIADIKAAPAEPQGDEDDNHNGTGELQD